MGPRAGTTAAVAAFVLAIGPTAAQAADLPVGETGGVRVSSDHGNVAVVFTARAARLYRRIAGRVAFVACTDLPASHVLGGEVVETKGEAWRVPKRRSTLRTDTLAFREFDYCRVWLGAHKSDLIVSVPLTQPGAVFMDEEKRSAELNALLTVAGTLADMRGSHSWPTPEALLTAEVRGHPVRDFMRRPLVALTSALDTPPPGDIGYYSDGGEHVAAVIVSASGRRLFLELDADDVVRTNVPEHVFGNDA